MKKYRIPNSTLTCPSCGYVMDVDKFVSGIRNTFIELINQFKKIYKIKDENNL